MSKSILIQIAVLLAVIVLVVGVLLVLPGSCEQNSYTVVVRRLLDGPPPDRYVNLTPSDLETYPLIESVLNAFRNPSLHPGSHFEGEYFFYPFTTPPGNTSVEDTNRFLRERWGAPGGLSYMIISVGDGSYYEWAVSIADAGPLGPCR